MGDWFQGNTVQEAYELNVPLLSIVAEKNKGHLDNTDSFIQNTADTVILETVKKAEDTEALVIRAYEYSNGKCIGDITFNREIKAAYACDMMEQNLIPIPFAKTTLPVSFNPFELKCFMLEFV
jgi:alpha-mannosidase